MAVPKAEQRSAEASRLDPHQIHRLIVIVRAIGKYLLLSAFLIFFLFPFFWIMVSAFKTSMEITMDPFSLPKALHWQNFQEAWVVGRFGKYFGNSVFYATTIVSGVVAFSCLAGYAFTFLQFPGRRMVFLVFLAGLMIPFQSTMIPLYYLLRDLKVLGTYWAMILPGIGIGLSFGIFLMRAFFRNLSNELRDAARIDGCNEFGVFTRIMAPLALPGMTTLAIFQFMWTWNSFLMPLLFVQREHLRPLALGMMYYFSKHGAERGLIAAGATISMVPIIIIYIVLQRHFERGMTAGALKS